MPAESGHVRGYGHAVTSVVAVTSAVTTKVTPVVTVTSAVTATLPRTVTAVTPAVAVTVTAVTSPARGSAAGGEEERGGAGGVDIYIYYHPRVARRKGAAPEASSA
jgi:hypothetical protein